jgi:hypothetical protein
MRVLTPRTEPLESANSDLVVKLVKWRYADHQSEAGLDPPPFYLGRGERDQIVPAFTALILSSVNCNGNDGLNHLERERLHAESINEAILQYQHPGTDLLARVVTKLLARFACLLEQQHPLVAERDKLTQLQWQEQVENEALGEHESSSGSN